jgi:hypothetical protein
MFKSKTVFVIGAGASKEAGLPTGEELKKSISTLFNVFSKGISADSIPDLPPSGLCS